MAGNGPVTDTQPIFLIVHLKDQRGESLGLHCLTTQSFRQILFKSLKCHCEVLKTLLISQLCLIFNFDIFHNFIEAQFSNFEFRFEY